jgi:hypothetical protein
MTSNKSRIRPLCIPSLLAVAAALASVAQAQSPPAAASPAKPSSSAAPARGGTDSPEAWFASMDKDHNGQLSLPEFKAGLELRAEAIFEQRLQAQFKAMDKDHSGFLEAGEFYALPILKSVAGTPPTLAEVDTNHDGKLDLDEYLGLLDRMVKSRSKP